MQLELSVVIATYNEEHRLPPTLERIFSYLDRQISKGYEVIIVDDGSTDHTVDWVKEYMQRHPQLRVIRLAHEGRGAAIRRGVLSAQGKFILETDADGSVADEAIGRFLRYFYTNPEVHMLIGSRNIEGAHIVTPQPFLRRALGYLFFMLASILFGWKMVDRINGFKMFCREAAYDIFRHQYINNVIAEAEIVFVAERRGWKIKELPVFWTDHRDSKIRPLRESWRSLKGLATILMQDRKGMYARCKN